MSANWIDCMNFIHIFEVRSRISCFWVRLNLDTELERNKISQACSVLLMNRMLLMAYGSISQSGVMLGVILI